MSEPRVYTVGEIQREVRYHLEEEYRGIWVAGEVSGHTHAASGHHYFDLKDDQAILRSVMWRSSAARLKFEVEEGLAVRARGHLTIYEPRGSYQMIVEKLEPAGVGPLQIAFEQMRARLMAEGLFLEEHKKPLPEFPRRVALVTSPTGAAVKDLIDVARRRWPALELVVVPVKVQGEGAAAQIAAAIESADRRGFDVLIVGRGGGSLEDLWAFNEEAVARAIYCAATPVVSAVGHEVDVSISDLVADLRAPTPSAAAELVTPDRAKWLVHVEERRSRLKRALRAKVETLGARLASIEASVAFKRPLDRLRDEEQRLDGVAARVAGAFGGSLKDRGHGLKTLAARLEALSPIKVLARGYSVTRTGDRVVTGPGDVSAGDEIRTTLRDGEILSTVQERGRDDPEA